MTDKWLEDIHNRMADFETDEPDGLWDGIQSHLPQPEPEHRHKTWAATLTWKKTAYYAAAAAAILFITMLLFPMDNNDHTATKDLASNKSIKADTPAHPYKQKAEMNHSVIVERSSNETPLAYRIATAIASQEEKECAPQPVATDTTQAEPPAKEQEAERGDEQHSIIKQPVQHKYYASAEHASTRHATRWTAGLYASGAPSLSTSTKSLSSIIVGASPGDTEWNDSPMLGILLNNNGKQIEKRVNHKQPIRIGLSLAHAISKRISLETGITYTTLRSDIREGSNSHYFATEQKLQYVGIPLNVKIKALSWKQVDIYASAGLMAEKCFSGKTKTNFILDDKNEGSTTQKIESLPYQVSANVGIGLQYNIDSSASLYVEPGVSYFFDDKSSIQTIYKEKPLNVNLNAGFRLSL